MSRKCLSSEAALTHLVPNPMRWGSVIRVISILQMKSQSVNLGSLAAHSIHLPITGPSEAQFLHQ